mgnify:FL=1
MKSRQSNFELLRILAMYMVLLLHALGSLAWPKGALTHADGPLAHLLLSMLQSVSIVAVNVFVLISGWFGIRPTLRSATKLLFQCAFVCVVVYASLVLAKEETFSLSALGACFTLGQTGWFVKSYLVLFILSPVLNSYVEHTDRHNQQRVLLAFYLFQTLIDWVFNLDADSQRGYSALSFIGLYLLAQYVRRFKLTRLHTYHRRIFLLLYLGIAGVMVAVGSAAYFACGIDIFHRLMYYTSPLVVVQSLALLLYVERLSFQSASVNRIAACCLAVYLVHQYPALRPFYNNLCIYVYTHCAPLPGIAGLLLLLCLIYVACIGVDMLRQWAWRGCLKLFNK